MTRTYTPRESEIQRNWLVIDATDVVLGRLASHAAALLRGKHKATFAPHVDTGDFVIIVNAEKVALTGSKLAQKKAYRHSGYPGGLTATSYTELLEKHPTRAVEKAIRESDLGLNPQTEGQVIRLRIPEMNEQRRKEMVKVAHKYAEEARVAVRHVRRDGLDLLKKLEKDSAISEDDGKRDAEQVQKATDQFVAEIDSLLVAKEKEIMHV